MKPNSYVLLYLRGKLANNLPVPMEALSWRRPVTEGRKIII
jgi:hypothetical protein